MLLIVQIWLLSATLESYLAGHRDAAVPGFALSLQTESTPKYGTGKRELTIAREVDAVLSTFRRSLPQHPGTPF